MVVFDWVDLNVFQFESGGMILKLDKISFSLEKDEIKYTLNCY